MEGKQLSAVAPAVAAASMHEEDATRPMEQLKVEAIASTETEQQRGWMRGTTALAWTQWASIKSKARTAGEYTILRTRQGISMFGEPKLGPLVKAAAASDESQ
ncbi:hypothetical protein SEVIR_9G542500v4 [Setaria viridis]|uniref:Uncharacterized protein n=2 Tax=Setaria TaxID=4554 RepID=A0A368SVX3_SETIT|nr:uncharacterized protein LOC101754889 [Setaria italica]XP_034571671.1 uncharacterized protein LOC117836371 [Setaria viridis]RCV46523.1 hypothetical protein SETIT_9G538200v2 [Setaria italica]TKV98180.1 hypothetical protein SEVIR_9G542500v2 [Setaria viridis]